MRLRLPACESRRELNWFKPAVRWYAVLSFFGEPPASRLLKSQGVGIPDVPWVIGVLMGLLRQAPDFRERHCVRQKADDEQPEAAIYRQQNAPTQHASYDQISDNRQQEVHAPILAALRPRASKEGKCL